MLVDGYVRVSEVGKRSGPRFISPAVQREAIQAWAKRQDLKLGGMFEELDESGSRADRPLLDLAIQRAEAHVTSGVVVWKVDRFGRSLIDGLQQVERIRAVGGTFYSVRDGFDSSTEAGRLALRILLSVAEFQAEGFRAGWEIARERAVRRGVYSHLLPVGYIKTPSGVLEPHPRTGPLITEAYARRAHGASWRAVGRFLEANEVRTGGGNPSWGNCCNLSKMLRSRVYLGEVKEGRFINEAAHPPLTDPATFQAARGWRELPRHEKVPGLLAGMARCSGCSHTIFPIVHRRQGRATLLMYTCPTEFAAGRCPAPAYIVATKLEPYVLDAALSLLRARRRRPDKRLAAAEARAAEAAEALRRYLDNDRVARTLGADAFAHGVEVRQSRVAAANLDVWDARARVDVHDLPSVTEIRRALPSMTLEERRRLVRTLIDVVFVANGRGPASERVTVCPIGTAPPSLNRRGTLTARNVTITPRPEWLNPVRAERPPEPS